MRGFDQKTILLNFIAKKRYYQYGFTILIIIILNYFYLF